MLNVNVLEWRRMLGWGNRMTGKTHAIVGANAIWVLPALGVVGWQVLPLLFVGMIGGLFPDIDAKESELHDETYNLTKLLQAHRIFGHRKFFHSFIATGLGYWAVGRYVPPILPAVAPVFAVGYLSHLIIDGFNTRGRNICGQRTGRSTGCQIFCKARAAVGWMTFCLWAAQWD